MANYNEEAVSKAIAKDPSIGGAEAKAIHSLLKGRERGPLPCCYCGGDGQVLYDDVPRAWNPPESLGVCYHCRAEGTCRCPA